MTDPIGTTPAPSTVAPAAKPPSLRTAARQFEAIFIRQMLAAARATKLGGEGLFDSQATDQFRQMQDENFAQIAADCGMLGLGATIERQLSARIKETGK
jgi:peptidoglycan hydrolase FlgJ